MAEFSKLIITGAGQALIAKVIAGTGNIRFTKVSTSDTAYEENKLEELTELSGIKQTSLISDIVRTNEVAVKIETAFHNTELTEGYYMRTMGLYAVDPDEGEILYAVTVETSGNCYIPPYNGVTVSGAYVQLITTVGNAEQVSLEVDAAAVATIGDLRELEEKIENLKMDLGDAYVQFVEYETRENIQAQDTLGTMFGKIKKWFTDLKAGAFSGVANNCTTTEEGSVLDARQGKMLLEEIEELKKVDEEINSNITAADGSRFRYAVTDDGKPGCIITGEDGADTVFPFSDGAKVYNIGSFNTGSLASSPKDSVSINISGKYPDYKKYTKDNFYPIITNAETHGGSTRTSGNAPQIHVYPSISYNPSTGVVTINDLSNSSYDSNSQAYCRLGINGYIILIDGLSK